RERDGERAHHAGDLLDARLDGRRAHLLRALEVDRRLACRIRRHLALAVGAGSAAQERAGARRKGDRPLVEVGARRQLRDEMQARDAVGRDRRLAPRDAQAQRLVDQAGRGIVVAPLVAAAGGREEAHEREEGEDRETAAHCRSPQRWICTNTRSGVARPPWSVIVWSICTMSIGPVPGPRTRVMRSSHTFAVWPTVSWRTKLFAGAASPSWNQTSILGSSR